MHQFCSISYVASAYAILVSTMAKTLEKTKKGHIGLFASSGTHSHDLFMHHLGETLFNLGYEITWIQYRVFEFNRTTPLLDPRWRRITRDCVTWETADFVKKTQADIWITTIPFDIQRWDFGAILSLKEIYKHHSACCTRALQDPLFWKELMSQRFDLIILDYILLECSTAMSAYIDAPVIHLSNFPISSSYSEWMNVPSNPSFVPSVLGPLPSKLSFWERVKNTLFFAFIALTRRLEIILTRLSFWNAGIDFREPFAATESRVLQIATVAEYFVESPRPQTHQMKYFGCPYALSSVKPLNISQALNISTVSPDGIIVVSFGGITSGEHIPANIIQTFMSVFGNLSHTVIWQFGSSQNTKGVRVPENVHLHNWIPLRQLLANPEVRLMIGHGGIRSLLEAIHQGLPVLGVPIQGPQFHDLRRVVDKGVAEMITIPELNQVALSEKLEKLFHNYDEYKKNVEHLSHSIRELYDLLFQNVVPSEFWLQWAVRHGRDMVESRRFYHYSYNGFFMYYYLDLICLCTLVCSLAFVCCNTVFAFASRRCETPKVKRVVHRSPFG